MDKVPKEFTVFATKITVKYDNKRLSNEDLLGDCSYTDSQISICNKYKGMKVNKSAVIDTFYHEKIHIILDAMGEHELSQNEKFVEVFARLLRQSDETVKY